MEEYSLILLYLIIGHLVGDFLLQTSKLVAYKKSCTFGIILHCLVIWASQFLLLLPYTASIKIWLVVSLVAILHFIIDYSKIKIKKPPQFPIIPFSIDQLLHFIVLLLAYGIIKNESAVLFTDSWWFESLYQNQSLLIYFAGVIFFSYTFDIVLLTFKLQKNPQYQYSRGYFDMIIRVSVFALIYLVFSVYVF